MDMLPPLTETTSKMTKNHRFRSLKLLNVNLDEVLEDKPFGADYGRLENGLHYYVRLNSKPRMRAALALTVKVGSVNEEDDERGVAHIVEHLAFSATTKYTNHDIVKFLESIGVEFGACQNASTSCDETIYVLFVPVDKPELLSEALSILSEFSTEVRVSKDDLEKERGAVMEEYRANRNAAGRILDSYWALSLEGSKYADRLPIGLEKVIRTVTPEVVKQFYKKWYHLHNMAVIAVGDFSDTQSVVELIKTHFGDKCSSLELPPFMPDYPIPSHKEPRFSCFVDSEADGSEVTIIYKMPFSELKTVRDYNDLLTQSMFICALNKRLFKISHKKDPPYFSCSVFANVYISPTKVYVISASCKEKGTIEALETMLTEVARASLHGFTDREMCVVRSLLLSEIESAYLERENMQSTHLRDEYIQHFLCNQAVVGIEKEAKLQKTLLPHISSRELSKFAEKLSTSVSCVIKIIEPYADAKVDQLKSVVSKINSLEEEQCIPHWDDENIPEEIVSVLPNPGSIVEQFEYSSIGATELILSNGMRVCYKCTDFFTDQVCFRGFSYGGLSEIPVSEYLSCSGGSTFAGEIGEYGYRPSVLMDMLAGKRVEVDTDLDAFTRTFSGDCSPSDLETALQLVYQLFTTTVTPGEEVKIVMQKWEESIHAKERDPYTAFSDRVREINFGNSYFYRPIKLADLETVDPLRGCAYFSNCFKDPSTFTMVIVGNIDPAMAQPLILQYLGGIPRPTEPILHYNRDDLKGLPITFPAKIIREVVRSPMIEAQCSILLRFQVELKHGTLMEDAHFADFLSKLLESRIMQVLRFKHGQIYSADVSLSYDVNKPSRNTDLRGGISISFSCDPDISSKLVNLALNEIYQLQVLGPSEEEVASVLEIEQRAHETGREENYYWLNRLSDSYQSRYYSGDVATPLKIVDEARLKVRNSLTPATAQLALQRILPFPCKKQYTIVMLMPQTSRFKYLKTWETFGRDAKILAGFAGLTILALSLWRHSRRTI